MPPSRFTRELRASLRPQSKRELAAQGTGPGKLRGSGWRQSVRGFHTPAIEGRITAAQRIIDVSPLLTGGAVLGGWAAAYLHGADWLDGFDPRTFEPMPIDCIGAKRRNLDLVRYHNNRLGAGDWSTRHGLPVTTPLRTAFDGARWAESLEVAVVFLDAMTKFIGLPMDAFEKYARAHRCSTGIQQALAAAALVVPGSRSPNESRLRVCYRQGARLPLPLLNVPVFWGDRFIGIPDLFDPDAALATEFDGDQHRDPEQHRRDNIREELFEAANVAVVRVAKGDLNHDRARMIARMRKGYDRGIDRDRTKDRWTLVQPEWWGYR